VAVYFRGARLATGSSHSIQQAEMNAATNALSHKSRKFVSLLLSSSSSTDRDVK
jgi:hypothetical protein